jgi:hypothetical protein
LRVALIEGRARIETLDGRPLAAHWSDPRVQLDFYRDAVRIEGQTRGVRVFLTEPALPKPTPAEPQPEGRHAPRRPGPAPGETDKIARQRRALFSDIDRVLEEEAKSTTEAVRKLAESQELPGSGEPTSRVKQLVRQYNKEKRKNASFLPLSATFCIFIPRSREKRRAGSPPDTNVLEARPIMPAAASGRHRSGRYGGPYGHLDHEITNWIRARAGLPLIDVPERPTIIREKEVKARTGLGRSWRWRLEKEGRFPRRVYLNPDDSGTS